MSPDPTRSVYVRYGPGWNVKSDSKATQLLGLECAAQTDVRRDGTDS